MLFVFANAICIHIHYETPNLNEGGRSSDVSEPSAGEVSPDLGPQHDAQPRLPRADGHQAAGHGGLQDVQDVRGVSSAAALHRGRR